jgi:tetratricopeptide (TPR) repeat protein
MEKEEQMTKETRKYLYISVAAVGIVYLFSLFNGFAWDDVLFIQNNASIHSFKNLTKLFTLDYFPLSREASYRPVPTFLYMVINKILSGAPVYFHLSSLLFHLLAVAGIYLISLNLLKSGLPALIAALIFGLHPACSEAVICPTFDKDLLAALSIIWIIVLRMNNSYSQRWKPGAYLAVACLFILGLFSKETALVLIPVLLSYDILFRKEEINTSGFYALYSMLAGIAIFYIVVRFKLMIDPAVNTGYYFGGTFASNLYTLPAVMTHYLRFFVSPWPLNVDHLMGAYVSFNGVIAWYWIGLSLAAGFLIFAARKQKILLFSFLWIIFAFIPVMNFIPFLNRSFWAERYMYLPLGGLSVALGFIASKLGDERKPLGGYFNYLLLAMLLIYATADIVRQRQWKDAETLYTADLANSPRSYRLYTVLSGIYVNKQDFNNAAALLARAIQVEPTSIYKTNYIAYLNLSYIYATASRSDLAVIVCREGLSVLPKRNPELLANYAAAEFNLGKVKEAAALFEEAYSADKAPGIGHNLGLCYLKLGEVDKAQSIFEEINQKKMPFLDSYLILKEIYAKKKMTDKAAEMDKIAAEIRQSGNYYTGMLLFYGEI